jgi:hypothetical protein
MDLSRNRSRSSFQLHHLVRRRGCAPYQHEMVELVIDGGSRGDKVCSQSLQALLRCVTDLVFSKEQSDVLRTVANVARQVVLAPDRALSTQRESG